MKPDKNTGKILVEKNDPRLEKTYGKGWMMIIGVFNLLITLVNIGVVVLKTIYTRDSYWSS